MKFVGLLFNPRKYPGYVVNNCTILPPEVVQEVLRVLIKYTCTINIGIDTNGMIPVASVIVS